MAEIPIYGTLVNATTDPKTVNTDQAWDKELGKYQSEINKERIEGNDSLKTQLDTLSSKVDKEITDRGSADTALGAKIDKEIADRTAADTALDNKLQNNINTLEAKHDAFVATKGKANGFASLDANGTVPANQLPSYVDDIIDVYATYDKSATGELTNIKLYSDAAHKNAITGEAGKIYINITNGKPPYQFRWTGTIFARADAQVLILGQITGTAFDGGRGKELENQIASLKTNGASHFNNNTYQASTVRLNFKCWFGNGNAQDHYSQITAATASQAGVMSATDKVKLDTTLPKQISDETAARVAAINALQGELADDIAQEVVDRDAAIAAAKTELTAAINKEVSDRKAADTQVRTDLEAAVELVAEELRGADTTLRNNITKEVNDRKGEITRVEGLISDEAATRAQADTTVNAKVDSHIGNKSNPHGVTKAQVGLGNVNNTSDANKPVSTAQATAIADAKAAGTNAQTNLTTHMQNMSNPHGVTRDQLGLGTTAEIIFKKVSAPSGLWKESDERLKTFIKPLEHTLDEICSIPTDSFMIRGNHDIGTIAQTIEKYFPELVSENTVKPETVPNPEAFEKVEKDGETYILVKEVDYSKMSVLAIEGIKLLKAEIDELREKLLFTNLD